MNTFIIGASGKIGKYFREVRKKDYYYTYNKSFFSNGILTKNFNTTGLPAK